MGFFKAYDMRGTFGVDFDFDTVYKVGLALPDVLSSNGQPAKRWLVGRDCRTTSQAMRDALVRGLCEAGADVTDLGLCTTPMVYFYTARDGYAGSVMITASHNPPTDNGMKVSKAGALPVGYENGLAKVEERIAGMSPTSPTGDVRGVRVISDAAAREPYIQWHRKHASFGTLRFAVDCSNGMASLLAHQLYPQAIFLNDTLDGTFPCHSPNPLKSEAREQLVKLVREQHLDCGVIFDGDADRAMFIDERGEFVQPDYLIPIIAQVTAEHADRQQGASRKVLHDVRTSRGAIEALRERAFEPVMVPVGHAYAKPAMRREGALCGGELAGHYYFEELHGCDSGILAATRVLSAVAKAKSEGRTFSEMMHPITTRYANSGELNFKVEDKEAAIQRVLQRAAEALPPEISRTTIDGIRIEYAEGWINIRKSNTEPFLRLILEVREASVLNRWVAVLSEAIDAR